MEITYTLVGKHSNRTPLSYPAYFPYLAGRLRSVSLDEGPDILVFAYVQDFSSEIELIKRARQKNPNFKVVVVSEEPFWDSLWSGDFRKKRTSLTVGGEELEYTALNHQNCSVFEFSKIPYFITTEDRYIARYAFMFRRNGFKSVRDLLAGWRNPEIFSAFFAEKRLDEKFDVFHSDVNVRGLCRFRSQLAIRFPGEKAVRVGRGWGSGKLRQKLPDWHLDKLSALDGRVGFVSALENTHQHSYVTEKMFDALAVSGIPLYVASENHRVFDLLGRDSFVNLYGLSVEEAFEKVMSFRADPEFAESYLESMHNLATLFSSAVTLDIERQRLVTELMGEIEEVLNTR